MAGDTGKPVIFPLVELHNLFKIAINTSSNYYSMHQQTKNVYTVNSLSLKCGHQLLTVADTGRKRTLFHCKWANLIGYISRMLY